MIPTLQHYYYHGRNIIFKELTFNIKGDDYNIFPFNTASNGFIINLISKALKPEEYIIDIKEESITIEYGSERALFYAFSTLQSLIKYKKQHYEIPKCYIRDYPSFNVRGIIEGFYGEPWSHKKRMDLISFISKYKMNAFFYAPKDDPYHRSKWNITYPEDKFCEIKELVKQCNENYVDFIFSVSPGLDIIYSSEEHIKVLCEKFYSLMDIGVKKVALLLDDINPELKHEEDRTIFKNSFAKAHTYLSNRVFQNLRNYNASLEFIVCPTEYWDVKDSEYKIIFKEELNKDIKLIWTGPEVISNVITYEQSIREHEQYGHDLFLWDNFPVNDGAKQLKLGPIYNRDKNLYKNHWGIVSNPMNQAEISKISLITYSDYAWNSEAYIPEVSYKNVLEEKPKEFSKIYDLLYENCQCSDMNEEAAPILKSLISEALENNDYEKLEYYLQRVYRLPEKIEHLMDSAFLEEIKPWFNKIKLTAELGLCAIDLLQHRKRADLHELLAQYKQDEYSFGEKAVLDLVAYAKVKELDFKKKLGQIFILRDSENNDEVLKTIKKDPICNVLIDRKFNSLTELKEALDRYKESSSREIFIMANHQGGEQVIVEERFSALCSQEMIGKLKDKGIAYNNTYLQAIELKSLGVDMMLSPNLNLRDEYNSSPSEKSYGKVILKDIIESTLRAYRSTKMFCCGNYFPCGSEENNIIKRNYTNLINQLESFKIAVNKNIPAILMSNALIEDLDSLHLASNSSIIIRDLLKDKYGFQGLILVVHDKNLGLKEFTMNAIKAEAHMIIVESLRDFEKLAHEMEEEKSEEFLKLIDNSVAKIIKYKLLKENNSIDKDKIEFYKELKDYIFKKASEINGGK